MRASGACLACGIHVEDWDTESYLRVQTDSMMPLLSVCLRPGVLLLPQAPKHLPELKLGPVICTAHLTSQTIENKDVFWFLNMKIVLLWTDYILCHMKPDTVGKYEQMYQEIDEFLKYQFIDTGQPSPHLFPKV